MNKKILSSIGLTLVGVTLYYFLLSSTDMTWALLWDTLQQMDFTIAAMCPILVSVLIVFSALKWRLVTEAQCEDKLGLGFYFRYISLSSALGQVLPLTLTNATVRALSLKRKDVMPVMKTAGLFLWDQGFDFLSLFLLLVSGLAYLFCGFSGLATIAVFGGCVTTLLVTMPIFTKAITAIASLLSQATFVPQALRSKFASLATANILAPRLARKLLLLSIGKFLISSAFYTCIVAAFGYISIADIAFWGAPSADMAGVLSQMPGGLGALDWTWLGIFTSHGIDTQKAAGLAFGIRCGILMTNTIVAVSVWSVYLALFKGRGQK